MIRMERQDSGRPMARHAGDQRPVGSRLEEVLRRQRTLPDWVYTYPELFDPVRFLAKFFLITVLVKFALFPFEFLTGVMAGRGDTAAWAAGGLLWGLSVYAFAVPHGRTNAFYLRAFQMDRGTYAFRRALEVGLGSDFRLSGIRSPRHHIPGFLIGLAGVITLLRYAGAKYMELEAGRGWMGRLVASYSYARIAFIDLRSLTEHVRHEAVLTLLCLGASRTVFVVDRSRSVSAWAQLVGDLAALPAADRPALQFVAADGDFAKVTAEVKSAVRRLPEGNAGFSEAGWAYVASIVPEADLVAESRRRPGRFIALGFTALLVASTILPLWSDSERIVGGFELFALLLLVLFTRSFGGAVRRAWTARHANREYAGSQLERALTGTAVPVFVAALSLVFVLGAEQDVEQPISVPGAGGVIQQFGARAYNSADHDEGLTYPLSAGTDSVLVAADTSGSR